jgi:hypothetical protein
LVKIGVLSTTTTMTMRSTKVQPKYLTYGTSTHTVSLPTFAVPNIREFHVDETEIFIPSRSGNIIMCLQFTLILILLGFWLYGYLNAH